MDLYTTSIEILKKHQHPGGAFPAAPNFPPYNYCWLRDGTFIAYALDLAGEHEAAGAFYLWAAQTIARHFWKLERLEQLRQEANLPGHDAYLHTRYTLEGEEGAEPWGNFQLDGYGAYLWGLVQHDRLVRDPAWWPQVSGVASRVSGYLIRYWDTPCLDCWEENPNTRHPSTLAAIYGGLNAVRAYGLGQEFDPEAITQLVRRDFTAAGHFVKFGGREEVDANLLWLATPFAMIAGDDPVMVATVEKIEAELMFDGGVHRYRADQYYGGGAWVLLTAWLGWHHGRTGNLARAEAALRWIEAQAGTDYNLPEQVPHHLLHPESYAAWVEMWGAPARPLLWSHAMYLILSRYR